MPVFVAGSLLRNGTEHTSAVKFFAKDIGL